MLGPGPPLALGRGPGLGPLSVSAPDSASVSVSAPVSASNSAPVPFSVVAPDSTPALRETPVSADGGTDQQAMAVGDVTCDGVPDLVVTAPAAGAVVVLHGDGTGAFPGRSVLPMAPGAWDVALGDFDEDGHLDLATANVSSSFTTRLTACNGAFTNPETLPVLGGDPPPDAEAPRLALGAMCPGQPGHLAVAMARAPANIFITCGDGSGSFTGVLEPHGLQFGDTEVDYRWSILNNVPGQIIGSLAWWPAHRRLYALYQPVTRRAVLRLRVDGTRLQQLLIDLELVSLGGVAAPYAEMVLHPWRDGAMQAAFVGPAGLGVTR